jgi:electron transfer flavoprotein alpha subunit
MNDVAFILLASSGLDRAAYGLMGAARRLAGGRDARLHAIVIGPDSGALAESVAQSADTVTVADQPELTSYQPETYIDALTRICGEIGPRVVLLSNDTYSQEIAPRLAYRLGGAAAGDGVDVRVEGDDVLVRRQVYGGKAQALSALRRAPAVVWVRARSFAPEPPRTESGEVTKIILDVALDTRARIVERARGEQGESRLEDARVIVSGGRGVGGPEPFQTDLRPLAEQLGAQMAASRAACDAGWVPPTWQVGQTGKKVAPDLYLAIALSGASQHLAGISEAKTIAAINSDPDAPIFKYCRFGIVGDYRKVVPLLREKLAGLDR